MREFSFGGITVRTLQTATRSVETSQIKELIKRIEEGNRWISDPKFKIRTCFVTLTPVGNQFVKFRNEPVILFELENFEPRMASHEMGHAIFDYYLNSKLAPPEAALIITNLVLRLRETEVVKGKLRYKDKDRIEEAALPAGIWIAEPSQWSKTAFTEHGWETADEFFASIREAFVVDRKGLNQAIKRFSEKIRAKAAFANNTSAFIKLLDALRIGHESGEPLTEKLRKESAYVLGKLAAPTNLEESPVFIGAIAGSPLLRLTVDPETEKHGQPRRDSTPRVRPHRNSDPPPIYTRDEKHIFFRNIFHSIAHALGFGKDNSRTGLSRVHGRPGFNRLVDQRSPSRELSPQIVGGNPRAGYAAGHEDYFVRENQRAQYRNNLLENERMQREITLTAQRNREAALRQSMQQEQRERELRQAQSARERERILRGQQERSRVDRSNLERQQLAQRRRDDQMRTDKERLEQQRRQQEQQRQRTMWVRPPVVRPIQSQTPGQRFGGNGSYNPKGMFAGLFKPTPPAMVLPPSWSRPVGVTVWGTRNFAPTFIEHSGD